MPKVVVEDTNFSQTDTKVTITPVIAKDKTNFGYESTLISKKAKYENGMTYVFNNFTGEDGKERKYDNIYNLDVSTIDKSGHTTKAQRITFLLTDTVRYIFVSQIGIMPKSLLFRLRKLM